MLTFPGYIPVVPTAHPVRYLASSFVKVLMRFIILGARHPGELPGTVKPLLLPKMKGSRNEGTAELRNHCGR